MEALKITLREPLRKVLGDDLEECDAAILDAALVQIENPTSNRIRLARINDIAKANKEKRVANFKSHHKFCTRMFYGQSLMKYRQKKNWTTSYPIRRIVLLLAILIHRRISRLYIPLQP